LFKIHLVSDIPKEICFFGSAPNEGGFKDSAPFHDLFCLNLYGMLYVSSSANVLQHQARAYFSKYVFINEILELKDHLQKRVNITRKFFHLESPRNIPAPAETEHVP